MTTDSHDPQNTGSSDIQAHLNHETAQISWLELQRFFAAGKAICIDSQLDLLEVATAFAEDKSERFSEWMEKGLVAPVSDNQARDWYEQQTLVWAVVVAPWVLVQHRI